MACRLVRVESPTKTLSSILRTSPPSMVAGGLIQCVSFSSSSTLAISTTSLTRDFTLMLQITAFSPNTMAVSSTKQLSGRVLSHFIQISSSRSFCKAAQYSACCLFARATFIFSTFVLTQRSYESGTGRTTAYLTATAFIKFITVRAQRTHAQPYLIVNSYYFLIRRISNTTGFSASGQALNITSLSSAHGNSEP